MGSDLPLTGYRVIERSGSAAAAYAGRLLATMGAEVILLEPPGGSRLRDTAPRIGSTSGDSAQTSALFAYLAAGKRSLVCDPADQADSERFRQLLRNADILLDDTALSDREQCGLLPEQVSAVSDKLVHVSVLPFGATGNKAHWLAEEINLIHASGEGYLLPNGLSQKTFPDRPPLQIYGQFAHYQGGLAAAVNALAALWAVPRVGGQYIDVSMQEATLLCGAFALQRLGDGSLEHRATRSFRYGGVFKTRDGYIELLTLEDRQWQGLANLLGNPAWSQDPALKDPLERSRQGDQINRHISEWMLEHDSDDIVARAQELGVPIGRYRTPQDILDGAHEQARGLFVKTELPDHSDTTVLLAPFQFPGSPLHLARGVPALGEASYGDFL